jgi:hypothetical protein
MKESQLHIDIVRYLKQVLPDGCIVHHSPNEGKRSVQFNAKLKRMGMVAGWPDIEIVANPDNYYPQQLPTGIFIEIKTDSGKLTDNQKTVIAMLEDNQQHVAVCKSINEVDQFVSSILRMPYAMMGQHP